jgi:hypothetical protein
MIAMNEREQLGFIRSLRKDFGFQTMF